MKPRPGGGGGGKGGELWRERVEREEGQGVIWAGHRITEGTFENGMCRPYF